MFLALEHSAGMSSGRGAVDEISGYLPRGINSVNASSLREPAILRCAVDVSVAAGNELGRSASIVALKTINRVPHARGGDFENSGDRWVGSDAVHVAVSALDEPAGVTAIVAASKRVNRVVMRTAAWRDSENLPEAAEDIGR